LFYPSDRVLVAIMNSRRDLVIARDEGWYRIPKKSAPPSTTEAVVLAFYLTRAFGDQKWTIPYYAAVEGHELVRRRDLFPHQSDHPHADDPYYKLQLGRLLELERPIPSLRWRRVTFIESTWDRLMAAEEINDLYTSGADGLYVTLKEEDLHPEREFLFRERGTDYVLDMVILCHGGTLAIAVTDRPAPPTALRRPDVQTVCEEVARLGGEQTRPTPA